MKPENFTPFGQFYIDPVFIALMNGNYFPAQKMRESVAKLREQFGDEWVRNIRWGDYQTQLVDGRIWPSDARRHWDNSVQFARADLADQPNINPVSRDDSSVPGDKCALLDACVRKCFNTVLPGETLPGIPMMIDVRLKAMGEPADDRHDVWLSWTYDPDAAQPDVPRQLNLTMVCPSKKAIDARRAAAKREANRAAAEKAAKKAAKESAKAARKSTQPKRESKTAAKGAGRSAKKTVKKAAKKAMRRP